MISGKTTYHEKSRTVTIRIRHESGDPTKTLTASGSKEGAFTITFSETKKTGKYRIEVAAPDGKGKGETEFEVTLMSGLIDKVEHDLRQLDDRIGRLLRQAEEAVISLPASEERDEYIKKIDDLQEFQRTVDLPDVKILGELRRVVQGPTVVFLPDQEIFGKLQEWDEEAEMTIEEIDRSKILDRSKEYICETINTAMEGLKFAALAFKVGKDLLHTLANVLIDKTISALSKAVLGKTPEADAAAIGLKNAKAVLHGKIGVAEAGPGLFAGALEPGVRWLLYNRYCGEYRCPIKVKMTMIWNEQGKPWMKYTIDLEGRMTLRFPLKSGPGQPLPMTGEIEGNAVKHEFWENVFLVEPLPKTVILLDLLWLAPPAFPNAVESPLDFGAIARTVTPASFNIPLIAEITGDRIKMQFKPARVDFSPLMVHRRVFVVFRSPPSPGSYQLMKQLGKNQISFVLGF